MAPLVVARKGYYTDLAKWAAAKGYTHLRVDGEFLPTARWPRLDRFHEHTIELPVADVQARPDNEAELRNGLTQALEFGKGVVHVLSPLDALAEAMAKNDPALAEMAVAVYSTKRACPSCSRSFPELDPRLFSFNSKHGWCPGCFGTGLALSGFDAEQSGEEIWWNEWYEETEQVCPSCNGQRLNAEALAVRYRDRNIAATTRLPVGEASLLFKSLALGGREAEIARDCVAELISRLDFLREVGLDYLALDRAAPTLSGGEASASGLRPAGLQPARCLLHPGRADDRPASARQRRPARYPRQTGGEGKHAGRSRARRGHDSPCRSRDRSWPGCRQPWRSRGGDRHRG